MKSKKLLTALMASSLLISGCSTMKEEKKENPVKNETDKDKVNSSSREVSIHLKMVKYQWKILI